MEGRKSRFGDSRGKHIASYACHCRMGNPKEDWAVAGARPSHEDPMQNGFVLWHAALTLRGKR